MSSIGGLLRARRARRMMSASLAGVLAASAMAFANTAGAAPPNGSGDNDTATPIKHVVILVGENHTFDNVFATYKPPPVESVANLASQRIIDPGGTAGPNAAAAQQNQATDTTAYQVDPTTTGPYANLPQPNNTYTPKACSGQAQNAPDARFPSNLPNLPYQITKYVPYFDDHGQYNQFGTCEFNGAFVGDPLHRFYQMYQEISGDPQHPGGTNDLWTWVHQTAGDSNGAQPPSPFTTNQGALDMGYYNMAGGDAPIFRYLAEHYAISDNYHQSVMGGTGANHIMLGTGDAAFFQDGQGNPVAPPSGEIENPNPQPGTNNFYSEDGYGNSATGNGGSYSNCSDLTQPGVSAVNTFLGSLPYKPFNNGDCDPGHYYLLNNYNPGYKVDGSLNTSTFTVPPQQTTNTIADELSAKNISWGYFGEGYNSSNGTVGPNYCGICDPFQYATSVMTTAKRANVQHGLSDFDSAVANGSLPAVSYLKPGDDDGHPGYSTLAAFENFVSHAVTEIQNQPKLWKDTAVFVTFDEGGGYYDSGPVQPVSFFGDGTRVPMLVISPFTKAGHIDHSYTDHVSTLKFIEANWKLNKLSARSLDNLPDPKQTGGSLLPQNPPAIGDMMSFFDFSNPRSDTATAPRGQGSPPSDTKPAGGSPHPDSQQS